MIEFERQAEERAKEIEQMNDERDRMLEEESRIQREMERIAQEEYEMRQYYEAEALKHAEEKRVHMEGLFSDLLRSDDMWFWDFGKYLGLKIMLTFLKRSGDIRNV